MERFNEQSLDRFLTTPSQRLIDDMVKINGDIIILGAGGKMGPSLALLAKNAATAAGENSRVYAVSRFTDPVAKKLLEDGGVEVISCDLMQENVVENLIDAENIIYMAGRKFGTQGSEYLTWAMNAWLPVKVCERYKNSRIVVFSSGNIYPFVQLDSGGADEQTQPKPNGEYAMSCLARERMFEYASMKLGTKAILYRLNYAVDLRYGVLYDIAEKIYNHRPVPVTMSAFNCIWQGDANEAAIRCLLHTGAPATKINITGKETVYIREAAKIMGELMGITPVFEGTEADTTLLSNSGQAELLFGKTAISVQTMIQWQVNWILDGGRSLSKPTHFEERSGKY